MGGKRTSVWVTDADLLLLEQAGLTPAQALRLSLDVLRNRRHRFCTACGQPWPGCGHCDCRGREHEPGCPGVTAPG